MNEPQFYKIACPKCAGRIEFPAEGLGATAACPHCGQPVELSRPAARGKPRLPLFIGVALVVAAGITGVVLKVLPKKQPADAPVEPAVAIKPVEPPDPPRAPGEELEVLKFKIEKATKGKLTYVTGTATNHVKAQFFSVKIEFEIFDKGGKPAGQAVDQANSLSGKSAWEFKALVLDEGAVTARLVKISGEKE